MTRHLNDESFVHIWNSAQDLSEAAASTDYNRVYCTRRAAQLRAAGYKLKVFKGGRPRMLGPGREHKNLNNEVYTAYAEEPDMELARARADLQIAEARVAMALARLAQRKLLDLVGPPKNPKAVSRDDPAERKRAADVFCRFWNASPTLDAVLKTYPDAVASAAWCREQGMDLKEFT